MKNPTFENTYTPLTVLIKYHLMPLEIYLDSLAEMNSPEAIRISRVAATLLEASENNITSIIHAMEDIVGHVIDVEERITSVNGREISYQVTGMKMDSGPGITPAS